MKEGDVVLVVGKLDDRVRESNLEANRIGTIVALTKDEVIVLLPNGDLWKGNHWNVVRQEEERTQSDS